MHFLVKSVERSIPAHRFTLKAFNGEQTIHTHGTVFWTPRLVPCHLERDRIEYPFDDWKNIKTHARTNSRIGRGNDVWPQGSVVAKSIAKERLQKRFRIEGISDAHQKISIAELVHSLIDLF